jgi:phage head maturation protease
LPVARELASAVEDGLLYQCSFAFRSTDQGWDEDYTIRAVDLH